MAIADTGTASRTIDAAEAAIRCREGSSSRSFYLFRIKTLGNYGRNCEFFYLKRALRLEIMPAVTKTTWNVLRISPLYRAKPRELNVA
jgi:hypothetical protein